MASRAGLVTLLVAVEIAIVGVAAYSVVGLRGAFGAGEWGAAWKPHAFDDAGAPLPSMDAGSSPVVAIDDASDRIDVTPSSDGKIHVTDLSQAGGLTWSSARRAKLTMTRTSDGVRIERPQQDDAIFTLFGYDTERIAVQVPPDSKVTIADSGGADVTGLNAAVSVHSGDGHITVKNIRGDVNLQSDDGSIEAADVVANAFDAQAADGHIEATGLRVVGSNGSARLHTDDGHVTVAAQFAPGGSYDVSSGDGHIRLTLASGADLSVTASTAEGRILRDGSVVRGGDGDASNAAFTLGNGSGRLRVSADDGTIEFTTNGAI